MHPEEFAQKVSQLRNRAELLSFNEEEQDLPLDRQVAGAAIEELQRSLEELTVAEEELRQQNEELAATRYSVEVERKRYQDLFDYAPEAYLVTDSLGKILEMNRSAAQLLNVQPEARGSMFLAGFVAEGERKTFRERLSRYQLKLQALADQNNRRQEDPVPQETDWEMRLEPRGTSPYDAVLTAVAVLVDEDCRLRWTIKDITERRLAQEALRESEARFRTLTETTAAAILMVQAGKIVYANPAAGRLTGYPVHELLKKNYLDIVHGEDTAELQKHGVGTLAVDPASSLTDPVRLELRLLSKGEEDCWVDLTAGPMQVQSKPAWMITAYDITRRVQVEQARTELLRRLVDAQEEERSRISRELHDQVGQSLSALILGLKSLEAGAPEPTVQKLRNMLEIAVSLARKTHQLALDLRPVALEDLGLPATLANYAEEWSERCGIEVDYQTTIKNHEDLPIQAALAIYRIVQEALTNVAKHAQARKVSLILTRGAEFEDRKPLSPPASRRPASLLAIVEDDGCGFEVEEMLQKGTSKGRLGLLGMTERAELLGGRLHIESALGHGTTVFVRIPVVQAGKGGKDG